MPFTLSAKQGCYTAQNFLGTLYQRGEGVLKDYIQAYMWYELASYNGSEAGSSNKKGITNQMTSADIVSAQDNAKICLKSRYKDIPHIHRI